MCVACVGKTIIGASPRQLDTSGRGWPAPCHDPLASRRMNEGRQVSVGRVADGLVGLGERLEDSVVGLHSVLVAVGLGEKASGGLSW
jgi:hypothetical protein